MLTTASVLQIDLLLVIVTSEIAKNVTADNCTSILACADRHMAALTDAGKLYVWGHGVGLGFADRKHRAAPQQVVFDKSVAAISCGIYHSAVTTAYRPDMAHSVNEPPRMAPAGNRCMVLRATQ